MIDVTLRSGLSTTFSKQLLQVANCLPLERQLPTIRRLINFHNPTHLHSFRVNENGELYGENFYSELLLLGFHCPGIRDDQCAVVGDDGYWHDGSDGVKWLPRNENILDEYEVGIFLYRFNSILLDYRERVLAEVASLKFEVDELVRRPS